MINLDASGQTPYQASGQEIEESFPLYDEFVPRLTIFDYGTDAELKQTQICRCPNDEETGNFFYL